MTQMPRLAELVGLVILDGIAEPRDPIRQLGVAERIAGELDHLGDSLVGYFVEQARAEGYSWADIGAPRGLSRQGAQQRYAPLITQLTVDDLIGAGVLRRFDDEALGCLRRAEAHARRLRHDAVDSGDLLLAVLDDPAGVADNVIRALGADPAEVRAVLEEPPDDGRPAVDAGPAAMTISSEARRVIDGTVAEAGGHVVVVAHLILGLLRMPGSRAGRVLGSYGITKPAALAHVLRLAGRLVEDPA